MNAADTNVLFYAHDGRDPRKKKIASELLVTMQDGVLLWQVACEYLNAMRKLEPMGCSRDEVEQKLFQFRQTWATYIPDWSALEKAQSLRLRYSLSFWDALLIASCIEAKISVLYSEDFDSYSRIETLALINPFK